MWGTSVVPQQEVHCKESKEEVAMSSNSLALGVISKATYDNDGWKNQQNNKQKGSSNLWKSTHHPPMSPKGARDKKVMSYMWMLPEHHSAMED